jgi:hypothetical protein
MIQDLFREQDPQQEPLKVGQSNVADLCVCSVVAAPGLIMGSENVLCWNVWGLNACSHRDAVREVVRSERIFSLSVGLGV